MLFLFLPLVFATPLCSLYIFPLNYVSNLSGIPQLMFQLDLFYQFQNQILTCYLGISTCLSHRHHQLKTSKQNLSFLSRKGYNSPPSLLFLLVPYSTQSLKFENCGSCLTFVISVQSVIHLSFFLKISLSSPLLVTSIFFFNNFICGCTGSHRCAGFSLVAVIGCYSQLGRFLIVVASLSAQYKLQVVWASVVEAHGLNSCRTRAQLLCRIWDFP